MNAQLILDNLLSPPILFFAAGLLAVLVKSDLAIPNDVARFLSLYLLFSIGLKGGMELGHNPLTIEVFVTLALAFVLAVIVPFYTFFILKRKIDIPNAGAIAATYGSVSAVTFVTAISFLTELHVDFGGHMIATLAIMESPAIIVGVVLIGKYYKKSSRSGTVMREALTNGSVFLILISLIIGMTISEKQYATIQPFSDGLFKGILTLFLLDMGLVAGKRIASLRKQGAFLTIFALIIPIINAVVVMFACKWLGIGMGNALLLTVLGASASYIAVPAAMRMAVPQANPGIYVPMSLGITFPFNIIIGIPIYYSILELLYR